MVSVMLFSSMRESHGCKVGPQGKSQQGRSRRPRHSLGIEVAERGLAGGGGCEMASLEGWVDGSMGSLAGGMEWPIHRPCSMHWWIHRWLWGPMLDTGPSHSTYGLNGQYRPPYKNASDPNFVSLYGLTKSYFPQFHNKLIVWFNHSTEKLP